MMLGVFEYAAYVQQLFWPLNTETVSICLHVLLGSLAKLDKITMDLGFPTGTTMDLGDGSLVYDLVLPVLQFENSACDQEATREEAR
jgi:hypothetical protein